MAFDLPSPSAFASTSRLEQQGPYAHHIEMSRDNGSNSSGDDDFAVIDSDSSDDDVEGAASSPPSSTASVTNLCTEEGGESSNHFLNVPSSATRIPGRSSGDRDASSSSSSAFSSASSDDGGEPSRQPSSNVSLPSLCSSATSMSIHDDAAQLFAKQSTGKTPQQQTTTGNANLFDVAASRSAELAHARSLLEHQAASLLSAARRLREEEATFSDFSLAQSLVVETLRGGGKLVWTGVGKSGIIARKLASTSLSLGMPATWLDPTEALHGDLGLLNGAADPLASNPASSASSFASTSSLIPRPPQDLLLALSHSGSSREVASLLPHVERRRIRVIALTAKRDSPLGQAARRSGGAWLDCRTATATPSDNAPVACSSCYATGASLAEAGTDEADPGLPAPSSSTTTALAMGDSLVLSCAKVLGLGERDFARNHPGGALGQRFLAAEAAQG